MPRRKSIWDIFDEFFREMEEEMRDFMERFERGFEIERGEERVFGPYVYGFSITIGPDGRPVIREFGNVRRIKGRPRISEEREPLVDVLEEKKTITVVAEMPGVDKDNIKIRVRDKTLIINAVGPDRKYYKEIPLPAKVRAESAKASYRNGVLEVKLEKEEEEEKGYEIKVE